IEGLEDGLVAVLTKAHHAMIDGISGVDIATVMFDFQAQPTVLAPEEWKPQPQPSASALVREAIREQFVHPLASVAETVQTVARAPARAAGLVGSVLGGVRDLVGLGVPPRGPFDVNIGPNRR